MSEVGCDQVLNRPGKRVAMRGVASSNRGGTTISPALIAVLIIFGIPKLTK